MLVALRPRSLVGFDKVCDPFLIYSWIKELSFPVHKFKIYDFFLAILQAYPSVFDKILILASVQRHLVMSRTYKELPFYFDRGSKGFGNHIGRVWMDFRRHFESKGTVGTMVVQYSLFLAVEFWRDFHARYLDGIFLRLQW